MRNILSAAILIFCMSFLACAQETDDAITLDGAIVDCNTMATYNDKINSYLDTYTKQDALKPTAVESGYGIFLEDDFMKFDKPSDAKIVEFLKKPKSTLQVVVQVMVDENDILSLVSIENKQ